MRRVLASEHGHALYKHRKSTVEPVFAQIKFNRKINRFNAEDALPPYRMAPGRGHPQPHEAPQPLERRRNQLKNPTQPASAQIHPPGSAEPPRRHDFARQPQTKTGLRRDSARRPSIRTNCRTACPSCNTRWNDSARDGSVLFPLVPLSTMVEVKDGTCQMGGPRDRHRRSPRLLRDRDL